MLNRFVYIKVQKGLTVVEFALIAVLSKFVSIKLQKGVTLIEYALIAALVAVVVIGGLTALGVNINTMFVNIGTKLPTP